MKHYLLFCLCIITAVCSFAQQNKDTVIYKGIPKTVLCSNFVLINAADDQLKILMSYNKTNWDTVFLKPRSSRFFKTLGNDRCYVRFSDRKYILRNCLEHILYKKDNKWDLFSQ
jgi:hypothetical protein